jgi:hypothetical protein
MSIYVLACSRSGDQVLPAQIIEQLHSHLKPANITAPPPVVHADLPSVVEFFGHGYSTRTSGGLAVGVGCRIHPVETLSSLPDHVQFTWEWDRGRVNIRNDIAGTRRIWYHFGEELFVASTSQRVIVALLRSFEPNEINYGWMLASACLAPFQSWDRRISSLRPNSGLTLDREAWSLSLKRESCSFAPAGWTDDEAREQLRQAVEDSVCALRVTPDEALYLSGGYDSRAILYLLLRDPDTIQHLRCFTRVRDRKHLSNPFSDPSIAGQVARSVNARHEFIMAEDDEEDMGESFTRFIEMSEGQRGQWAPQLHWRLAEEGVRGVYSGAENLGWNPVGKGDSARRSVGLWLQRDFDADPGIPALQLFPREVPDDMQRQDGETDATWRDRLYHEFRAPCLININSYFLSHYFEPCYPLLADRIIRKTRLLSDSQRTGKRLFIDLLDRWGPTHPRDKGDLQSATNSESRRKLADRLTGPVLRSAIGRGVLDDDVLRSLVSSRSLSGKALRFVRRRFAPGSRKSSGLKSVDTASTALRACVIVKTLEVLERDSGILGGTHDLHVGTSS